MERKAFLSNETFLSPKRKSIPADLLRGKAARHKLRLIFLFIDLAVRRRKGVLERQFVLVRIEYLELKDKRLSIFVNRFRHDIVTSVTAFAV